MPIAITMYEMITCNSKHVQPGAIFFAVPCSNIDEHIMEARQNGASVIVREDEAADDVEAVTFDKETGLITIAKRATSALGHASSAQDRAPSAPGATQIFEPLSHLKIPKKDAFCCDTQPRVERTRNVRRLFAMCCGALYNKRPQKLIGVTGTNGKSSVVHFVSQILSLLGVKTASIGTLGVTIGREPVSSLTTSSPSLTTFDPMSLHKILQELAEQGVECAAIECTSHGLDQSRLDALSFDAVALTNVTQDHLDYHKTMQQYALAKTTLFSTLAKSSAIAIFEKGAPLSEMDSRDPSAPPASDLQYVSVRAAESSVAPASDLQDVSVMAAESSAPPAPDLQDVSVRAAEQRGLQTRFFSLDDSAADICLLNCTQHQFALILDISIFGRVFRGVSFNVIGELQIKNLLCALGLVFGAYKNLEVDDVVRVIPLIQPVPGRLEFVQQYNGASIFVDYCHTPDALKQALASLKRYCSGGICLVMGCGGERDAGKRHQIGKIAAQCKKVFITDDNPRHEDPAKIRREILAGATIAKDIFFQAFYKPQKPGKPEFACCKRDVLCYSGNAEIAEVAEIPDRAEAILCGIKSLQPGDLLLIAGRGHELFQKVGDQEIPFSDAEVARACVHRLLARS